MNIVRKFVAPNSTENPSGSTTATGDTSLSLQHLKKLLAEFKHPQTSATVESQEKKFYNMLPLFCKVFEEPTNLKAIYQIFPEAMLFCSHASKLMVNEISRKARNQSTVTASVAICNLLQRGVADQSASNGGEATTFENGQGWVLLKSLCLMASAGPQLVDCMSNSSLPSTLVKCVYLFYDLPELGSDADSQKRRKEFEGLFSSLLLTSLSTSPSTAEELARKTDLMLLVTASSSNCPLPNSHWHKTAIDAIATIAKFGLKPNVVAFMHSKGAIGLWIENLRQIGPPSNLSSTNELMNYVDMLLALIGFVQESTNFTNIFLEDFRQSDGYGLLARTIFAIETVTPLTDFHSQLMRNLLLAGSLQLATSGSPSEPLPPTPSPCSTVHVIPGFAPPSRRDNAQSSCLAIRYTTPLSLLSTVFNGARTDALCLLTLDVISNLLHQDMNNYFWLEQDSLLSDLLLKFSSRTTQVQNVFLQIIEEVVTNLSYVPVKELNSIAMLFKQPELPVECRLAVIACLARLSAYSTIFADVYRDMGLIELVIEELQRLVPHAKTYAAAHEAPKADDGQPATIGNEFLLLVNILDLLALLVATNSKNADVIREVGGSKIALSLVAEEPKLRLKALMLLQSLILASAGDEELTQLLLLAQTCPLTDLELKSHIFKIVVSILRQNHRCRSMFRRIAGFVYTVSILVQLEEALAEEPKEPWKQVKRTDILVLIRLIFSTLTIVMRYEPANARHFAIEVKYANLAKAVRRLGCFPGNPSDTGAESTDGVDSQPVFTDSVASTTHALDTANCDMFSALFHSLPELPTNTGAIPKELFSACLLFRFLLDMACDLLDRPNIRGELVSAKPTRPSSPTSPSSCPPLSIDILEIDPQTFGSLAVVHPGAISAIIHLVPDVTSPANSQAALDLQWFIVSRLSDLMIGMRNQQVMAEAGMAAELLTACSLPLAEEQHFLHRPLVTIFERIAAHWLSTNDLRSYMRLGNVLNCLTPAEKVKLPPKAVPAVVPLERVKSLVSINTHRPTPPAVEVDMRYEGFGCLFIPSICPMMSSAKLGEMSSSSPSPNLPIKSAGNKPTTTRTASVSGNDLRLLGGVGTGERSYPPTSALSYSCWFCVDQFSMPGADRASITSIGSHSSESSHPIFFLLLTKQDAAREDSSDVVVSFAVFLTAGNTDRSLIVMTQEQPLTSLIECFEASPELSAATSCVSRFPLPALAFNSPEAVGKWHQIVVTLARPSSVLRYNNNLTAYFDGKQIGTAKTSYIASSTITANAANMVCAYVGTPPLLRRRSPLRWRLGPVVLAEEIMSANVVVAIYNLGPNYTGSYQAVRVETKAAGSSTTTAINQALINDEKLTFALHPSLMSSMTVAKIRKVFSKEDGKLVSKQLQPSCPVPVDGDRRSSIFRFGMPSHENATPVRIIHNAAVHLPGSARSLGAVLVGYLGVRTFAPRPCSTVIESIGGAKVLLGLVANADSETQLYAAMKALVTALRCNRRLGTHMRLTGGYQLLSLLLRRKHAFLSGHILQLILSYAGVVQLGPGNAANGNSAQFDSSSGLNRPAFRHLVCDLRIWQSLPCDIQQLLYEQLIELVSASMPSLSVFLASTEQRPAIIKLLFEAEMPARLFSRLRDPSLSIANAHTVLSLLQFMFCDQSVLLQFGQFLAWLLPPAAVVDEVFVNLDNAVQTPNAWQPGQRAVMLPSASLEANIYVIQLRNLCLRSLHRLIFQHGSSAATPYEHNNLNKSFIDALFNTLGADWLMLFLQSHLHPSTTLAACNIIFAMLADNYVVQKFREVPSSTGGGWLSQADVVIRARMGHLPGISVSGQTGVPTSPIGQTLSTSNSGAIAGANSDIISKEQLKTEMCKQPGFAYLYWLLPSHSNLPQIWFYLMGLFLGQPYRQPPSHSRFDNDSILDWALASRSHATAQLKIDVCPEAGIILFSLARTVLSAGVGAIPPITEYPQNLFNFVHYLFRSQQNFVPIITSHPFISAMVATLFPTSQMPRQFLPSSPIRNVAFDLLKSIYMSSLSMPPLALSSSNSSNSAASSITHSVASRTTSLLGGVAGTIGATVSGGSVSGSASATANTSKDPPTPAPLLDTLLIACIPEDVSKSAVHAYRTELICLLANSLTNADVLASDKAVLSLMGNNYGNTTANVFAFATRIADALWSGSFTRSSQDIYDYLTALLQQAKRKGGLPLEALHRPINRTLLYKLSRPLNTALALSNVIKTLQTIHAHQLSIFSVDNIDPEFAACLTYCLLALTGREFPRSVNELDVEAANAERNETVLSITELENSHSAVSSAAKRVWEHVYLLRKDQLEESTRTALSTGGSVGLGHDIDTFRQVLAEPALHVWEGYIEEERRRVLLLFGSSPNACPSTPSGAPSSALGSVAQTISGTGTAAGAVLHRGLTRMSSKVAGFTTGLLSRSRGSESSSQPSVMLGPVSCPAITAVSVTPSDVTAWTQYHASIVSELVNWRWQSVLEDNDVEDRRLQDAWSDVEQSLLSFPGLWGPNIESSLIKHQLSMAEGPMRMRKFLLPNSLFYEDYPLKNKPQLPSMVSTEEGTPTPRRGGKLRLPHSLDSEAWNRESLYRFTTLEPNSSRSSSHMSCSVGGSTKTTSVTVGAAETPLVAAGNFESEELVGNLASSPTEQGPANNGQSNSLNAAGGNSGAGGEDRSVGGTSSKLLRGFLEDGDQVQHIYRCARVQGLDSIEGLLLFGSEHLYILDGFTLLKSKEIVEISRLPADLHRPIVPTTCYASGSSSGPTSTSISSSSVHQLRQQHAKLRYSTIREVLKRRYLLQPIAIEVFSSDGRTVLLAFPHTQTRRAVYSRLLSVAQSLLDSAELSVAGQKQGAHVETSSNLLSILISDRSVTDRWVRNEISNFQYLMHLNTLAARSYNDLMQYPVFPWILADYDSETLDLSSAETFRDLSKPMGAQTPERVKQFEKRYREWEDSTGESDGTHYSSAMIVASYLVRLEPFTQIFLRLQGGCFDLPDRMFHSVREQWLSASRNNMTDVKELIPEFFYLPEFLLNSNRFDFGNKQNGTLLDDAVLPTWAHGSAREFVRIHRAALESDYVSAHLNEWIDLIFGCKQSGPEAVETLNVFHPYFYKGTVDIDSITDPVKRNATIGFINNFGQMPKQLFKRAHPTKRLGSDALLANSRLVFHHVSALQPAKNALRELKLAVGQLCINERGQVLAVEQNKSLIPPHMTHYIAWGFADMSVRIGAYDSDKTVAVYESLDNQMVLCALCPSPGVLLTAGKSSFINVWRLDTAKPSIPAKLHAQLVGHSDAITCLTASTAYRIILSGSRNGVTMQWDLNSLCYVRQLCHLSAPISALATNELTGDIAVCATTELHVFSLNGLPLCSVNACPQENQQVLCVAFSQMNEWDDANIIMTGGSDGFVRIWSLQHTQVPAESPSTPSSRNLIDNDAHQQLPHSASTVQVVADSRFLMGGETEPLLINADEEVDTELQETAGNEQSVDSETHPSASGVDSSIASRSSTPSSFASSSAQVAIKLQVCHSTTQMVWQYQIVFRGKLTAQTAYGRNDNRQAAAVTALCLSRDHRALFVGDARGHLLSWLVPENPGSASADHWVRDSSEGRCQRCKTKFSVVERKHHCRDCGRVVCSACSPHSAEVVRIKAPRPVRVCSDCYSKLTLTESTTTTNNNNANNNDTDSNSSAAKPPSVTPPPVSSE